MNLFLKLTAFFVLMTPFLALGEVAKVKVNVDNYVRAESDLQFDRLLAISGGVNKWNHSRVVTPVDQQPVIRMNRDTLYSMNIVDIRMGATLVVPELDDRYFSVMVINQDHYLQKIFHAPGKYKLTMEEFGTPYILLAARILVDPAKPENMAKAAKIQDGLKLNSNSAVPFTHPDYDLVSLKKTADALKKLGEQVTSTKNFFGKKEEVDATRHLIGTAMGWGGFPEREAVYISKNPGLPVGEYKLTLGEVPVDGFWSITVYNKDGFFEKNKQGRYNVNSLGAVRNEDETVTVHFGGCDDGRINCLPITEGWNYMGRFYKPRREILFEGYDLPALEVVKDKLGE